MDKTALLKKVRALAEHGVGGEAENAEKLLARMMKKYGISEEELDEKHRIFAIRADVEPQEISREEALKMGALMQGMSDESPLRAIEAGK